MNRLSAGLYEHHDCASGTTWRVFHDHGEVRGVNRWVYMRTDAEAWQNRRESEPQDAYTSKRDAVAALMDRLGTRAAS